MKDLIVNSLELLSKIAIILTVVIGFLTGMTTGHFWNAIAGAAIAFMISVVIFGIIFLAARHQRQPARHPPHPGLG